MLCHDRPGRTAGSQCKGLIARSHLLHIMLCLRHTAQIRSYGRLVYLRKTQLLQRRLEHVRRHLGAELPHKSRGHLGNDLLPGLHGPNQLENLRFVRYGPEGAADHAHAAGNTDIIVYIGPPEFVRLDGINAAGRLAGPLLMADSVVGTNLLAFSAFDAFFLINDGFSLHHGNGALGTDAVARMRHTAHA